ncbi:MAG: cyclic nucleotide-binding domain-containing protein [Desulfuromonadales bacterium]|jgi:CRP/FNR family transcriptional regulator, cyclic AMP receptor protein
MDPLWNNIFRKRHDEDSLAYFLNNLPMFAELNGRELNLLEKIVHLRNYEANEPVFEEGDPGTGMYMIRKGAVSISAKSNDGNKELLANLGPGDFFGETTLTAPAPRSATARVTDKTELVGLFRADLLEMVERQPTMTCRILIGLTRVVSERLQTASLEIRNLNNRLDDHQPTETVET